MNKRLKFVSLLGFLSCFIFVCIFFLFSQKFVLKAKDNKMLDVSIVASREDEDYMVIDNPKNTSIYNLDYQYTIDQRIQQLKKKNFYTIFSPLFILNPYGTNVTGMYVYFETNVPISLDYTISSEGFEDYSNHMNSINANDKIQEGQIIGLLQGTTNYLTFYAYNEDGECIEEETYAISIPDFGTISEPVLTTTAQGELEELTDGLFVIFGYDRKNTEEKRHLLFYDNHGIIRAEIPLKVSNGDVNLKKVGEYILYTCSDRKFCLVNPLGKIITTYNLGSYSVHHDFDYDGKNKVAVLADKDSEDTIEDLVITLDLTTGTITETLDFKTILPDIYERAVLPERDSQLDWIHFNTVDFINETDILLSSRELSTIIRINDIYSNPEIAYFIADEKIWEATDYEDQLLEKIGSFPSQTGQHTVTYQESEYLEDGQYYIYLYNNNWGYSSTMPDFDWTSFPEIGLIDKDASNSYYYKYLVDERNQFYALVDKIPLPYSSIVSSVQELEDNIIFCSGKAVKFGEYNSSHELLVEFTLNTDNYSYRVFKYSMNDFWF